LLIKPYNEGSLHKKSLKNVFNKKGFRDRIAENPLYLLARLEGFEPSTNGLEVKKNGG